MARDIRYDKFKKKKSSSFKRIRHYFEFITLALIQRFASLWPVKWNQKAGAVFGQMAYLLAKKDRGIAEYQLEFCFPEWTPAQRRKILHSTFKNMGMSLFEALIIDKIRKNSTAWVRLGHADIVHDALAAGNGAVFMFAHVGNWELFAIVYEMLNIHGIAVESPIGVKRLDDLLLSARKSDHIEMIPRGDRKSARAILNCFRNNGVFLFAMDQDTRVKTVYVDFFGRKAATAVGAATFAQKFNAPVISAFGARMKDGSHLYSFELLSRAPYKGGEEEAIMLTRNYNVALEKAYP